MLNYETFCYLQNQKTACTFVETFLRTFANEKLIRFAKHRTPRRRRKSKFYFVNVREPVDLYKSLFSYGLDKEGAIFTSLRRKHLLSLYEKGNDGFEEWLLHILDPANSRQLSRSFEPHAKRGMGLATWRYLRLATFDFKADEPCMNYVIKYETLVSDMNDLITNHLGHALSDVPAALAWVANSKPINSSSRRDRGSELKLSAATRRLLLERDKYLYDTFYPEQRDKLAAEQ